MVKGKKEKEGGIGLGPSTFVEGTGLISDVDAAFKEVEFVLWDYNGKIPEPAPALRALLGVEGEEVEQYWSAGSAREFVPSDDGKMLLPVGSQAGLNKNCNAVQLLQSIADAGFEDAEHKIEDDISIFEGMIAHVVRVPAPKRPGLAKPARADGRVYEDQVLVVDSIIKLPWESEKGKKAAPKEETEAGPLEDKATATVLEVLEKHKSVDKKQLVGFAHSVLKGDSDRSAIITMIYKDEFLKDGPWSFDDGVVSGG